jgi:2-keto-4-pentenoate hydratase/2-oxohepta-3-ene-1,7-dioic acid hydratase in catechol pathway
LGGVIGRVARDVHRHDAARAIEGYTIVNDVMARDVQSNEQQ